MTATTAEAPTRTVRKTTTVKTEVPATPKSERFGNWLRRLGESIRRGWNKFWGGVRSASSWVKDKIFSGGRKTVRGMKWIGNKLYWSGGAVGRGIGRGARFFGRSTLTLGRGTKRFLGRTLGWTARSASWTVRTGLETLFAVSLASWLVIGAITMFLAWGHDGYEQNVHRHAKAASRGEYRADAPGSIGAAEARRTFADRADLTAGRVGHWQTVAQTTVVEEQEREPFTWHDLEDPVEFWLSREAEMNVPEDLEMEEIADLVFSMADFDRSKNLPIPGTEVTSLVETERGMALSDNDIFQGKSYWQGRLAATRTFDSATKRIDMLQPWDAIVPLVKNRMGMAYATTVKDSQSAFDNRELHKNSFKHGWDHQVEYLIGYLQRWRDRALTPEQLAEAEAPPAKKTAAKATAKKTAARA